MYVLLPNNLYRKLFPGVTSRITVSGIFLLGQFMLFFDTIRAFGCRGWNLINWWVGKAKKIMKCYLIRVALIRYVNSLQT